MAVIDCVVVLFVSILGCQMSQERTVRKKRERKWLEQQVATGIEANVRTLVGEDTVDSLLSSPDPPQLPNNSQIEGSGMALIYYIV